MVSERFQRDLKPCGFRGVSEILFFLKKASNVCMICFKLCGSLLHRLHCKASNHSFRGVLKGKRRFRNVCIIRFELLGRSLPAAPVLSPISTSILGVVHWQFLEAKQQETSLKAIVGVCHC